MVNLGCHRLSSSRTPQQMPESRWARGPGVMPTPPPTSVGPEEILRRLEVASPARALTSDSVRGGTPGLTSPHAHRTHQWVPGTAVARGTQVGRQLMTLPARFRGTHYLAAGGEVLTTASERQGTFCRGTEMVSGLSYQRGSDPAHSSCQLTCSARS